MKPLQTTIFQETGKAWTSLLLLPVQTCANQVAFDLQLRAKLHGFLGRSWSSAPGLNQMRMVTSKWCSSWWLLKKPGKKVTKRTKKWHQRFIFLHFSSWMSANGIWIQEAPPAKLMGGARIHHIFHRIFAQARSLCSIVFSIENTPRLCQMLILLIPFHQVHHQNISIWGGCFQSSEMLHHCSR